MLPRSLRNTARLCAIALTLAREDALFIFSRLGFPSALLWLGRPFGRRSHLPEGERLARALERLGPTFVKLGQTLSTRSDLIGQELAEALSSLRDNLPPFDSGTAHSILAEELGDKETVFAHFSPDPIAAASIAQVHRALTRDGREVAVKILRPGIRDAFARDLDLFFWLAEMVERRLPHWRRLKPVEVVRTFQDSVAFELDLRYEAAAATEMRRNIEGDDGFRVPAIDWNLSTGRVLVMEWVQGIPLSDTSAILAAGHDLNMLLTRLSENFFRHVFRDGFFHADLHPGNLFVDAAGTIVAVDFGIMGRLDWKSRLYVAEILRGFLSEDYRHVAEVHFRAGYVPAHKSIDNFTLACMAIAKPILDKPLHEVSVARLLGQLFSITETFEMETQPQLLLLQKTMMVVEGVGRMLNPQINMWEMAREPIRQWAEDNLSVKGRALNAARQSYDTARKLPELIERLECALERLSDPDGIKIHAGSLNDLAATERSNHRQWLALAWTALLVFTALLLSR